MHFYCQDKMPDSSSFDKYGPGMTSIHLWLENVPCNEFAQDSTVSHLSLTHQNRTLISLSPVMLWHSAAVEWFISLILHEFMFYWIKRMISHKDPTLICCQFCFPSTVFNAFASAACLSCRIVLLSVGSGVSAGFIWHLLLNPRLALFLKIASVYSWIKFYSIFSLLVTLCKYLLI